jgi:hypothetical protein
MSKLLLLRQVLGVAALAIFPAFFLFPPFKHMPKIVAAAAAAAGFYLSRASGVRAALVRSALIWLAAVHSVALVATAPVLATSDRESEVFPLLGFHALFGVGYWYLYSMLPAAPPAAPKNKPETKAASAASKGRGAQ